MFQTALFIPCISFLLLALPGFSTADANSNYGRNATMTINLNKTYNETDSESFPIDTWPTGGVPGAVYVCPSEVFTNVNNPRESGCIWINNPGRCIIWDKEPHQPALSVQIKQLCVTYSQATAVAEGRLDRLLVLGPQADRVGHGTRVWCAGTRPGTNRPWTLVACTQSSAVATMQRDALEDRVFPRYTASFFPHGRLELSWVSLSVTL
jgi:hypothetical protein